MDAKRAARPLAQPLTLGNPMFGKIFKDKNRKHFELDKHDIGEAEIDYWSTVSVESDDTFLIVRVRTEKPPLPDLSEYKHCVSILWEYAAEQKGLPGKEVNEQQLSFECALDELMMYNNLSFLMGVSNGMGLKEWVFYVKDNDEFMEQFNRSLSNLPEFPVKIEFIEDPNWSIWGEKLEFYTNSKTES